MVDLDFSVEGARFERQSLSPLMLLELRIANATPAIAVQHVALQVQVRIQPTRRSYDETDHDRLSELFGEPERWGETLTSFLWARTNVTTPAFGAECRLDLPVPCSFDFGLAATKYFHGLTSGEVPLVLLFSGTIFYRDEERRLQVEQIPWNKEASYRLPVSEWKAMMDHHWQNAAWLRLERETFERLWSFRRQESLPDWEHTLGALLERVPERPLQ